jgi:adenylate cyclase
MMKAKPSVSDGHGQLRRLLADRNQQPDRTAEIDAEICQTFQRKVAILALDMCGFSRLTAKHGIIHYLAMIHQMQEGAVPAITGNGGTVIKQEADNLWATFDQPAHALEAALDIFRAFDAINSVVPEERDIRGSIGIGYGDTLVIGDEDLFGNEMNLASKLGEDLAGPSEILLTPAARAALPAGRYRFKKALFTISGMDLNCYLYAKSLTRKPLPRARKRATP